MGYSPQYTEGQIELDGSYAEVRLEHAHHPSPNAQVTPMLSFDEGAPDGDTIVARHRRDVARHVHVREDDVWGHDLTRASARLQCIRLLLVAELAEAEWRGAGLD